MGRRKRQRKELKGLEGGGGGVMYGWCGTVVKSLGFSTAKEGMNVFVFVVGKGLKKRQEAEGVVSGLFIIFGLEDHCGKKNTPFHYSPSPVLLLNWNDRFDPSHPFHDCGCRETESWTAKR